MGRLEIEPRCCGSEVCILYQGLWPTARSYDHGIMSCVHSRGKITCYRKASLALGKQSNTWDSSGVLANGVMNVNI